MNINTDKHLGTFAFRDSGNGQLTGLYLNTDSKIQLSEVCQLIKKTNQEFPFCGTYTSIWDEGDLTPQKGILEINQHPIGYYELVWSKENGNRIIFNGFGMLYDNLLIGSYWDYIK